MNTSEPGSAEQFFKTHWQTKLLPDDPINFAEAYAAALRAQLQEREREIAESVKADAEIQGMMQKYVDDLAASEATIQRLREVKSITLAALDFIGKRDPYAAQEAKRAREAEGK